MTSLRDYQAAAVDGIRAKLYTEKKRSVVSQLPTGAGKTVIVASIIKTIQDNNKNKKSKERKTKTWFIVPRNELINQTKKHYARYGISFGVIDAKHKESRAYDNQIVSLQTLMRRLDRIKEWPEICFIDECHLNYDAQLKIMRYSICALYCDKWETRVRKNELGKTENYRFCVEKEMPCVDVCAENNKTVIDEENPDEEIIIEPCEHWKEFKKKPKDRFIGLTATPCRSDGQGLGTLYDDIVYGKSIPYLVECGFLAKPVYYAPPTDGIRDLKFKTTGEVDQDELDKLLTERAVYGRAVDYYEKLAKLPNEKYRLAVGFCAGIKAAEKQAGEFRARGFKAEYVSGDMPEKKQRALIDGLAEGRLQVLCSADLLLYGWDSPNVSYGFLLRRTKSKALFFQIVGRILRVADGKSDAIFVDHTATVDLHTDPAKPGVPPFYLDHVDWDFHGKGKGGEKDKTPPEVRLCPYDNFRYCDKPIRCPRCEKYAPVDGEEQVIESVPLQERVAAMTPHVVTPAEKREIQDAVISAVRAAREADGDEAYDKAVKELCDIADRLGYRELWVYWQVTESRHIVDDRAIFAIGRVRGHELGWCYHVKKEMRKQIEQAREANA